MSPRACHPLRSATSRGCYRLLCLLSFVLGCALLTPSTAQIRSEFFSRDGSFSFQDTDRFTGSKDSSALLHLLGPHGIDLLVTKSLSQAHSLTEVAQRLPSQLESGQSVRSQQMTTVGSQLATMLEIVDTSESSVKIWAIVLRDGQEYLFQITVADQGWTVDQALALLDQIRWRVPEPAVHSELEFRATDHSFTLLTTEDFRVTHNPHAVMSLANLEDVAVVVTKAKAEHTLEQLYEGIPRSLPGGVVCQGRMMLSVGSEQGAGFVLEGMFPPQGPPTHSTLLAVVVRQGQEYNFMIHYPVESPRGLEDAHALLARIAWRDLPQE